MAPATQKTGKSGKRPAKAGGPGYRGLGGAMKLLLEAGRMRNAEMNPGPAGVVGQNPPTLGRGMLAKQLGLGPYRPIAAGPRMPAGQASPMAMGMGGGMAGVPKAPVPMPSMMPATKTRLY